MHNSPVDSDSSRIVEPSHKKDIKSSCRISEVGHKILLGLFIASGVAAALSFGAYVIMGAALLLSAAIVCAVASTALGLGLAYSKILPLLPPCLQKVAHQVRSSVVEIFAFFAAASTYFIDLTKQNPPLSENSKQPILLVHGYLHNSSAWIYFKKKLEEQDLGPVWTINLGDPFGGIDNYAQKIAKTVEEIHQKTSQPVRLIGHSMGGLVSLQASCRLKEKISQVITLGSPLDGTYLGKVGMGQCAAEMGYNSPFIQELRKQMSTNSVNRYHFYSETDGLIFPRSSAAFSMDTSPQKDHRISFSDIGHISLVYSDVVISKTIEVLKAIPHASC